MDCQLLCKSVFITKILFSYKLSKQEQAPLQLLQDWKTTETLIKDKSAAQL